MKDITQLPLFKDFDGYSPKYHFFKNSLLGKIHDSIPWDDLLSCLPDERVGPGAPSWFGGKGMIALMFLKSYLNTSDRLLLERYNTDWSLQYFCGKVLAENQQIKDMIIMTRIRSYLETNCEWETFQEVLITHWKQDVNNSHVLMMDATCYESYIRFPTDVKLLWECCEWIFEKQLYRLCKENGIVRPRSKYREQKLTHMAYSRKRKNSFKVTLRRRKALVYLLEKGIGQLQQVLKSNKGVGLSLNDLARLATIKKVHQQQEFLLDNPPSTLKDRIVSLHKPYLRPIVRGKENKPVEFGAKAHILQVDGLTYIDKLDFNAFNECTRLKLSVTKHKRLFGSVHQLGADRIYATNKNRKFCTDNKIFTCFPKKGPRKQNKSEKVLSSEISKQRATVMEGVFGVNKEFYGLRKIRVKGAKREKFMIFFGIMAGNAVKIAKRRAEKELPPGQKAA
ncbi:transposase [Belliella sp. DSM 111904]|uniref:Transposase n=1 Tax=Belliella filtrata TaxID=2923435 RepID=A0ABS9V132_9BACT|nr:transposase [Belliella filtrata]MCH7410106.1 transposase [Belliella filtrata]